MLISSPTATGASGSHSAAQMAPVTQSGAETGGGRGGRAGTAGNGVGVDEEQALPKTVAASRIATTSRGNDGFCSVNELSGETLRGVNELFDDVVHDLGGQLSLVYRAHARSLRLPAPAAWASPTAWGFPDSPAAGPPYRLTSAPPRRPSWRTEPCQTVSIVR